MEHRTTCNIFLSAIFKIVYTDHNACIITSARTQLVHIMHWNITVPLSLFLSVRNWTKSFVLIAVSKSIPRNQRKEVFVSSHSSFFHRCRNLWPNYSKDRSFNHLNHLNVLKVSPKLQGKQSSWSVNYKLQWIVSPPSGFAIQREINAPPPRTKLLKNYNQRKSRSTDVSKPLTIFLYLDQHPPSFAVKV